MRQGGTRSVDIEVANGVEQEDALVCTQLDPLRGRMLVGFASQRRQHENGNVRQ